MKKNIICAGVIVLILAASAAFIALQNSGEDKQRWAYVYSDDVLVNTISLNDAAEPYTFTVETADGGYNVVSVKNGEIGISEASCPDLVCVHTGYIHSSALPVVCLPNKLVIRIGGAPEDDGVDAVAK